MRKRLVIVGPAWPYRGGPPTYVGYLYESLSRDYDVKVVNFSRLYPDFLFPGTTQYDESRDLKKHTPSERVIDSINPLSWARAANEVLDFKPDLVIVDWYNPFFGPCLYDITRRVKRNSNARIVFITENVISHEARLVDAMLTRVGLRHADAFIALADKVAQELARFADGRGVYRSELPIFDLFAAKQFNKDDERRRLGYTAEDRVILFFGYVREYKGLDVLLRAMPTILQADSNVKLLVAGEFYQKESMYRNLIAELDLNSAVQVYNKFIPNEDVGRFYALSDFVALPYKSATQSGILTVAYSFKRPVLVTDVGGLAEFVESGRTGLVVPPNEPAALAQGALDMFSLLERQPVDKNIEDWMERSTFGDINRVIDGILQDFDAAV